MKKILVAAAAFALSSAAVMAQVPVFAEVDADGDGVITWAELEAGWPGVTEDQFAAADLDGSGDLDEAEWEGLLASLEVDADATLGIDVQPAPQ